MPKTVQIEFFCIAETKVNAQEVAKWLEHLNVSDECIVDLFNGTDNDPALLVALAAKQCYLSFEPGLNPNVTKVRKDMVEYLDNILGSKHGSVLEHCTFTFAINNVSRVFTGEMNRHRAGVAISERSMRYIRYQECVPFWMPECFLPSPEDDDELKNRKSLSRGVFLEAFKQDENNYKYLSDLWDLDSTDKNFHYKKIVTSALRRILGMGVATGGVWTLNLRALRHVLAIRTSPAAEEEIAHVWCRIGQYLVTRLPEIFGDFKLEGNSYVPKHDKV